MAVKISKSLSPLRKAYGVVSYRNVPLYRCQAWALELIEDEVTPCILSGIRDDAIIEAHNRKYGTNLHGQQYLVNLWRAGKGNPANSPNTTSHCHHADGNKVYGAYGANIPLVKNGIDACSNDTATRIVRALNKKGFRAAQPYNSGSELHHFSLYPRDGHVGDYVKRLRRAYVKQVLKKPWKPIKRRLK